MANEETALLSNPEAPPSKPARKPTPLPKLQLGVLLFTHLVEPISATVIDPFINQLISELDITGGDPAKVGHYVGIMISLFFAAETLTVMHWSRLSDHIGRRPVLMMGFTGIAISMVCFGLSRSFWLLVVARSFQGLMNGNTGVTKSMVGELTDSTNMAQAFALLPVAWSTGMTLAPFMGGILQKPHEHYPAIFRAQFWSDFPYFLPCFVAALFSVVSFLVTLVFLKETVDLTPSRPLTNEHRSTSGSTIYEVPGNLILQNVDTREQGEPSLYPHPPPPSDNSVLPLMQILTPRVILSVANYFTISLIDISYFTLLPLFLATPIDLGGLGLDPPTIGYILGAYGLGNGFFQAFAFARIVGRFGLGRVYMAGELATLPMFAMLPLINLAARSMGVTPLVWVLIGFSLSMAILMDMSFGSVFIYISSSAPNKRSLGATNGVAQQMGSIARTVGPALFSSLFAFSAKYNILGGHMVYVVVMAISCLALRLAAMLPKEPWGANEK